MAPWFLPVGAFLFYCNLLKHINVLSDIINHIICNEEMKGKVVRIRTSFPSIPSNDLGYMPLSQVKELRRYCDMLIQAKEPSWYIKKRFWRMAIKRVKPSN